MPEITVTLHRRDGRPFEITITLDDESYAVLSEVARKRNLPVEEVVIEALRVEQLLADGVLLVKEGGRVRELVSA